MRNEIAVLSRVGAHCGAPLRPRKSNDSSDEQDRNHERS
jgi:hypothetical protein